MEVSHGKVWITSVPNFGDRVAYFAAKELKVLSDLGSFTSPKDKYL
jgi:hypothetical protein